MVLTREHAAQLTSVIAASTPDFQNVPDYDAQIMSLTLYTYVLNSSIDLAPCVCTVVPLSWICSRSTFTTQIVSLRRFATPRPANLVTMAKYKKNRPRIDLS